MAPSFCPALTTILLHHPLFSANSLHSRTTSNLRISLLSAQSTDLNRGRSTSFPPILLPRSIHSLCHSLFPHPHQLSSPPQPAFHQSPHQDNLHSNLLHQFIHPPSIHLLYPCNLLTQLFSQMCSLCCWLCQCHCLQAVKVVRHCTRHQNLPFQFSWYICLRLLPQSSSTHSHPPTWILLCISLYLIHHVSTEGGLHHPSNIRHIDWSWNMR